MRSKKYDMMSKASVRRGAGRPGKFAGGDFVLLTSHFLGEFAFSPVVHYTAFKDDRKVTQLGVERASYLFFLLLTSYFLLITSYF